jgi:hypothetical protein
VSVLLQRRKRRDFGSTSFATNDDAVLLHESCGLSVDGMMQVVP